jgi:hypothetical protein
MKKARMILLVSAIVIELTAMIIITKAYFIHSSSSTGPIFFAIGLVFLVIGMTKKHRTADRSQSPGSRDHASIN